MAKHYDLIIVGGGPAGLMELSNPFAILCGWKAVSYTHLTLPTTERV